jgi:hypothetical protein
MSVLAARRQESRTESGMSWRGKRRSENTAAGG